MNKNLCLKIGVRLLLFFPVVGILIFLPAGTLNYWEAWMFIAVFFACNLALTGYLVFKDPKLLERRMKVGPAAEKTMATDTRDFLVCGGFTQSLGYPTNKITGGIFESRLGDGRRVVLNRSHTLSHGVRGLSDPPRTQRTRWGHARHLRTSARTIS